ncbi:MAG: hypothetical protein R3Y49_03090 [Rikenellaceae bacterium]
MAKSLRYYGEFLSQKNKLWRIELHQSAPLEFSQFIPEEVICASEPLVLKWAERSKLDCVESSTAQLTLLSDSDRRFIDMYQLQTGAVLLNVYRDGELYWSGTLDPELYEEPYAYTEGYEVTLTFADFAALDRINYSELGVVSLDSIFTGALSATEIEYTSVTKLISTKYNNKTVDLTELYVNSENFYDEYDEAMTLMETLESILQPLALKIKQKDGVVYLYDLNCLYSQSQTQFIQWSSTDSTLNVDSAYNNIILNFSPYSNDIIFDGSQSYDDVGSDGDIVTIPVDSQNLDIDGFDISLSDTGNESIELNNGAKFFKVNPVNSGSQEAGVAYSVSYYSESLDEYVSLDNLPAASTCNPDANSYNCIIKTPPVYVPSSSAFNDEFMLKISLDTLFDVKFNPYESSSQANEEGNWERLQNWANLGYIGIKIYITNADESATPYLAFQNYLTKSGTGYTDVGAWSYITSRLPDYDDCYLCYYDLDDRRSSSGFNGWSTNKAIIGFYQDELPSAFQYNEDGMLIPFPPLAGHLVVEVSNLIDQYDYNRERKDIYQYIKWVMFRNFSISVVRKDGRAIEQEDVEYSAWIDDYANEELSIDTTLGSMPSPLPIAKGLLLDSNAEPVGSFERAGVVDTVEKLLIGTAYCNYSTRHTILSGEAYMLAGITLCQDSNSEEKYWIAAEELSAHTECGEISTIELKEEDYTGINYE